MRRIRIGWLGLMLTVVGAVQACAVEAAFEPVIEIRGINRLATAVERMAQTLMFPVTRDQVIQSIDSLLMTTNLAGINADGAIRIYMLPRSETSGPAASEPVLSVPLSNDPGEYMDALEQQMDLVESTNGLDHFAPGASGMRFNIFSNLFVKTAGARMILGPSADAVNRIADTAAREDLPIPGVVALGVDPRPLVGLLEDILQEKMADSRTGIHDHAGKDILDLEFEYVFGVMNQLRLCAVGLDVEGDMLTLNTRATPAASTKLETYFSSIKPPAQAFRAFSPSGALLAGYGNLGDVDLIIKPYRNFMTTLFKAMGQQAPGMEAYMSKLMDMTEGLYSGDIAFALVAGETNQPIQILQLAGVRDAALMKQRTADMIQLINEQGPSLMPGVNMTARLGATRTYRDTEIQSFDYAYNLTNLPAQQAVFMATFMKNSHNEMAYLPSAVAVSQGDPRQLEKAIDHYLDGTGPALTADPSFAALFERIPDNCTGVFYVRVMDLLRQVFKLMPQMADVASVLPPVSGTVAGYEYSDGASRVTVSRVSLKELGALLQPIMMMKATAGAAGKPGAGPGPRPSRVAPKPVPAAP